MCKHEFDARYQKPEDKLYIAQLYFPLISQVWAFDLLVQNCKHKIQSAKDQIFGKFFVFICNFVFPAIVKCAFLIYMK